MTTLMKLYDLFVAYADDDDAAAVVDARHVSWEEGVEVFVGFSASFLTKVAVIFPAFPGSFG